MHKCQGQTLTSNVVVDTGLTFVALSRVTKMSDLQLTSSSYDKLQRINNDPSKPDLLKNIIRLQTSSLKYRQQDGYIIGLDTMQQRIRDLQAMLDELEHPALTVELATSAHGRSRIIPTMYRTGDYAIHHNFSLGHH